MCGESAGHVSHVDSTSALGHAWCMRTPPASGTVPEVAPCRTLPPDREAQRAKHSVRSRAAAPVCSSPVVNAVRAPAAPVTCCGRGAQVIGSCNGSGKIVLKDSQAPPDAPVAVDLNLETVLGDLPQKSYEFPEYKTDWARQLELPARETPGAALQRVLRMPAVGSKRFLTTKVDRCVTGLPPLPSPSPVAHPRLIALT